MKTFQEVFELSKNPGQNLKQLVDELLFGCSTTDEILKRWNDFTMEIAGYTLFTWETHNSKKVLMCDISKGDTNIWGTRQSVFGSYFLIRLYSSLAKNEPLLAIYNMENLAVDKELLQIAKELVKLSGEFKDHKVAMYGLSTIKKMVLKVFVTKEIKIVESKQEAIDWVSI